jgi:hypothetical protein
MKAAKIVDYPAVEASELVSWFARFNRAKRENPDRPEDIDTFKEE